MALTRKRLIQVKKESTYGTDSSPAGTDALLVRNLEITPIEADIVSRDLIRNYLGNSPQLLANTRVSITFQVELAGSGTAGTAPRYGALLQACGLSETIVASTSVTYAPVSSSFSSATIYFNNDGIRHILTGCRGTFTLNGEVGQIPTIDFTMVGVYNAPTDTAQPTTTYSAQASPLIFKQGNTSAFQFQLCRLSPVGQLRHCERDGLPRAGGLHEGGDDHQPCAQRHRDDRGPGAGNEGLLQHCPDRDHR